MQSQSTNQCSWCESFTLSWSPTTTIEQPSTGSPTLVTWVPAQMQLKQITMSYFMSQASFLSQYFSVATPAGCCGEQILLFANFGRWFIEKCQWTIFKQQERGLKTFGHVSDRFFGSFFLRFSKPFLYRLRIVSGAISFCRHATLTK